MKLTDHQIDLLSFDIAKHIRREGLIECNDPDALVDIIKHAISQDLQVEDRLNEEVREILTKYQENMRSEGIQFHEMFKIIKAKLVKERKLIL
ncbi:DUF507 family protein [Acidobacteriota bacterium]